MLPFILLLAGLANAQYFEVQSSDHSIGPDGPWWPLYLNVGESVQHLDFYPSFDARTNWFVTSEGCQVAGKPQCVEDKSFYYNIRTASAMQTWNFTDPGPLPRNGTWGYASQVMNYTGTGLWHFEKIMLNGPDFLNNLAQATSNDTVITFPGGASYKPVSTLSLSGVRMPIPYTNNATHQGNSLLVQYQQVDTKGRGRARSFCYTAGSVTMGYNGSFGVGGYDQNTIIEDPGYYSSNNAQLQRISLTSATGAISQSSNAASDYLTAAGVGPLSVSFDPSLPYLYLPDSVCKAIATTLPISYNKDFNVYLWNTSSIDYQLFTTSPSYLTFAFDQVSIRVPLALFNLILDTTLTSQGEQYFPCYSTPSNTPMILGRAFMQAATIIRNYDTNSMWLGQAPGPGFQPSTNSPIQFTPTDTKLQLLKSPPSWESTWDVLKVPINGKPVTPTSTADSTSDQSGPSLPLPSLIGLIIGVFASVIISIFLAWFFYQRRKNKKGAPMIYIEKGKDKAEPDSQPVFELFTNPIMTHEYASVRKSSGSSTHSAQPAIAVAQANLMADEGSDRLTPMRSELDAGYGASFPIARSPANRHVSRNSIAKGDFEPRMDSNLDVISPLSAGSGRKSRVSEDV